MEIFNDQFEKETIIVEKIIVPEICCVYLVKSENELTNEVIFKVGKTNNFKKRFDSLNREFKSFGFINTRPVFYCKFDTTKYNVVGQEGNDFENYIKSIIKNSKFAVKDNNKYPTATELIASPNNKFIEKIKNEFKKAAHILNEKSILNDKLNELKNLKSIEVNKIYDKYQSNIDLLTEKISEIDSNLFA